MKFAEKMDFEACEVSYLRVAEMVFGLLEILRKVTLTTLRLIEIFVIKEKFTLD